MMSYGQASTSWRRVHVRPAGNPETAPFALKAGMAPQGQPGPAVVAVSQQPWIKGE